MKKNVVFDFVHAINAADLDKIIDLMTDDHIFIDSQDNKLMGKDNIKQAWIGYFELFPDYKIEIQEILEKDSLIGIFGYASGTFKNIKNKDSAAYWRIPAAWTAVINDNKVKQWQVYADNSIVLAILNRNK